MKVRQRRRCSAHRTDGEPCQAWAMYGSSVCRAHGGAAPRTRQRAAERLVRESFGRQLAHAEQRLAERRAAWWTDRVLFVARHTGEDPQQLVHELASPVERALLVLRLPLGVGWPVGLRHEDEPQLQLDRRFGRRPRLGKEPIR